jgi:cytochrome c553
MDKGWTGLVALLALVVAATAACTTDVKVAASSRAASAAEACDTCHPGETRSWKETYHAKVARAPHEALVKEAAQYWSVDSKGNAGPSHGNLDGKVYGLADVEMVVGTRWKQRFLVKNPATGHHQFLDKQWNSYTGVWEDYANKDDWDSVCSTCHEHGKAARIMVDSAPTAP